MEMYYDGVKIFCLPDEACCTLAGKCPLDIPECPDGNEACDPDCPYYTEDPYYAENCKDRD